MSPKPGGTDTETGHEHRDEDLCAVGNAVELVGSKWTLIILNDLRDGEKRFNEIKRSTGASSYTLSRVLDTLEEEGFVDNRMELDAPVASYYRLTEKGEALCPVFDALDKWADDWL